MSQKDFVIDDVLKFGWEVMKANFWFLAAAFLVTSILLQLADRIPVPLVNIIVSMTLSVVFQIGMIRIALSYCDQIQPAFGILFQTHDCFWRVLVTALLYVLIVLGGILLFIIPGIIWAVKFSYAFYFVVDKGLDPIDALRASGKTTQGVRLKLFVFCFVYGLLYGALSLAFVHYGVVIKAIVMIGSFFVFPVFLIAQALIYRHLLAQTPELAEFGIAPVYSVAAVPVAVTEPTADDVPPTS